LQTNTALNRIAWSDIKNSSIHSTPNSILPSLLDWKGNHFIVFK